MSRFDPLILTTTDAHVAALLVGRAQTGLDIPQALPAGQLGEGHAQVLVPAGEVLDLVVAVVALDAGAKRVGRQEVHKLREDRPSGVHPPSPSARMRKYGTGAKSSSNRLRTSFLSNSHGRLVS